MRYNLYNISGGATKIAGLLAKSERILVDFGYRPDVVTGVSAGAILSLPIVLGKWDEVRESVLNITPEKLFDVVPFKPNGKLTLKGVLRTITGKGSFGTQNPLFSMISSTVSHNEFLAYQRDKTLPKVIVGVTNFNTGRFKMVDVKKCSYDEYVKYTVASSAIPLAVEAVKIYGEYYYDGGVTHHTCCVPYMHMGSRGVGNVVTVYSRPNEPDTSHFNFNMVDVSQVAARAQDIMTINVSLRDEEHERLLCERYGINLVQTFCPRILSGMYDMDHARLRKLYDVCRTEDQEEMYKEVLG